MTDEAAPAPAPRSIGERLRAGRERSGLSVAAAAEKLHLDPKVIEALEADRFAELGASVYVRGHLRRYGDFVGERGEQLVDLYTAREARPPPPDLTQIPQAERHADPKKLVTPLLGLGCALVLAGAIWWVLAGSKPGAQRPAPAPAVAQAPPAAPGSVSASSTLTSNTTPVPPSPPGTTAAPVTVPVAQTKPPPAAAPASSGDAPSTAPREAAAPRETRLRLELSSESWVEVYDARGERLFFDVASAGSVQSIVGRPPLRVVLGNAPGVAVLVDGEPRQIPESALEGDGARFVVNRSGSLSRARQ